MDLLFPSSFFLLLHQSLNYLANLLVLSVLFCCLIECLVEHAPYQKDFPCLQLQAKARHLHRLHFPQYSDRHPLQSSTSTLEIMLCCGLFQRSRLSNSVSLFLGKVDCNKSFSPNHQLINNVLILRFPYKLVKGLATLSIFKLDYQKRSK